MRNWAWVAFWFVVGGCDQVVRTGNPDLAGREVDLGQVGQCDSSNDCPEGQRCYRGRCLPDNGTCASDKDCQNDTYCDCTVGGGGACAGSATGDGGTVGPANDGVCVPYGFGPRGDFDPACNTVPFPAAEFQAATAKCDYEIPNPNGLVAPGSGYLTVGDLDGDGRPEIVSFYDINSPYAIHASDCSEFWSRPNMINRGGAAIGDLDGDGVPEVVIGGYTPVVLDSNGNLLASSTSGGSFVIANIDGAGLPELVGYDGVLRYHKGDPTLEPVAGAQGSAVVVDMDGDGTLEAIRGNRVADATTGVDKTPSNLKQVSAGRTAVADFNGDGAPDLVNVEAWRVSVFDYARNKFIFGPFAIPRVVIGYEEGGQPNIDDFDGDGVPDFGFFTRSHYLAYALRCADTPKPVDCTGADPGILWERPVLETSSAAATTFDFNGDGIVEVVLQDGCWVRAVDGRDGRTRFAVPLNGGTGTYFPLVVDADNDGHADILVLGRGGAWCDGQSEGQSGQVWSPAIPLSATSVLVLSDPQNRWMPARGLWNQYAYHITNINDDLSVPLSETPHWRVYNNFLTNNTGSRGNTLPDLTGGALQPIDNGGHDCQSAQRLWANLCNRGASKVGPGIPGTFYTGDPRLMGATAICTARTRAALDPGACEAVYCDWLNPPGGVWDLWFRANADGAKAGATAECKGDNDLLFLPGVSCTVPG